MTLATPFESAVFKLVEPHYLVANLCERILMISAGGLSLRGVWEREKKDTVDVKPCWKNIFKIRKALRNRNTFPNYD
jgi:hypothetical protein